MTEEDLQLLGRLLAKAPPDALDQAAVAGQVQFFAPGTASLSADCVYVIVDGLLSVRLPGRATSVEYVTRGQHVRPDVSRNANIRVIRETRTIRLPGDTDRWLVD